MHTTPEDWMYVRMPHVPSVYSYTGEEQQAQISDITQQANGPEPLSAALAKGH
jgi:hypothetical protein